MKYKKLSNEVKSVLRYPGGKSKALKYILPCLPSDFNEFREPFVGGGSVFIAVKQRIPTATYVISDLNSDLMCLWSALKQDPIKFKKEVIKTINDYSDGKTLFLYLKELRKLGELTSFQKAVRYFILNRISFSGAVDAGGYSRESYEKRLTDSIIERIIPLGNLLKDVDIQKDYYRRYLKDPGDNVFIFVDPPYLKNIKSKLYGKKGILHIIFDHETLSYELSKCKHRWLATLDDSEEIRDMYDFANMYEWTLQYGMNNVNKKKAKKGKELFISNYEIPHLKYI